MFDKLLSNKYFIIALIIALVVVIYLYSQKKSCDIEGMRNIDLAPLSQEIIERPWADDDDDGKYRKVNKKTDKNNKNNLKRKDEVYMEYEGCEDITPKKNHQKKKKKVKNSIPKPLDDRPDLSQCQPCICPQDKQIEYEDSSDSDEDIYIPNRKNNYRTPRKKLN